MTQPAMYDIIDAKRSVRKIYTESLIGRGDISVEEAEHALRDFSNQLEHVFNEVRELERTAAAPSPSVEDEQLVPPDLDTSVPLEVVHRIGDAHVELPEGFTVHPRVKPVLQRRHQMSREGDIDWAFARAARARLAADGRQAGAAVRAGHPARHVRAAALGGDRPQDRRRVLPAAQPVRGPGAVPALRLGAVASSPRSASSTATRWPTRTRSWPGRPSSATSSTAPSRSSTSSSRPARPSGARPPTSRCCCRTAWRARAPTTPRAGSSGSCTLCAEGSMTVAVPSEPANYFHLLRRHVAGRRPAPAGRVHPEVDAAQPGRGQPAVRVHRRPVPPGDRRPALPRPRRHGDRCAPGAAVQRQDLLRAGRGPRQARHRRHRDRPDRAALPGAGPAAGQHPGALPERRGRPLGPGGAGQPGRRGRSSG